VTGSIVWYSSSMPMLKEGFMPVGSYGFAGWQLNLPVGS